MRRREANHDAVASFAGSYVRPCLPFRGLLVAAVCLISGTSPVWAEGFRNPPPGAFNLGRAGGRIAQVDDSSAVQQNPANLVDLPTTEMQFAPTVVDISAKFKSPNGQTAETEDPWKLIPNFFAGMPLDDGKFALGLGITVPFGLGSKWKEDSSAFAGSTGIWRYQAPQSTDLQTINVNPAVAMKIGERLRLGVGLDVMWTELTLKEFYPWAMFPGSAGTEPDGDVEAKGDGFGVGANAGVTWSITDRQRLAFTVRSPMDVTCEGNFTINNLTPAAGAAGVSRGTDFSTEVHFPTILAAGYGIQLTDKIRVEADGEWVQFSRFKSLDLNVGKDALLFPTTKFAENWKDTFTAGLGGDWKFATNWVLRAGYQFYQSPVPDSTFSPTIPDADQNVFTIGLGYRYKHHSLEAAYGADFYDTRHIRNDKTPAFNGDYEITVNLFSFAYRYSF